MEGEATWKIGPGIPGSLIYTADCHMSVMVTIDDGAGRRTQVYPCEPGNQILMGIALPPGSDARVSVHFERPLEDPDGEKEARFSPASRPRSQRRGHGARR